MVSTREIEGRAIFPTTTVGLLKSNILLKWRQS